MIQPPNYEWRWYYFDVHSDDGYDLVVILHDRPFMSWFPIVIFDIKLYYRNKVKLHHYLTFPQSAVNVSSDPLFIRCDGENHIRQDEQNFFIKAHDAKLDMELIFTNLLAKPSTLSKEIRFHDGHKFSWKIIAPFCAVKGKLVRKKETVHIKGKGYHDSNSGSGPLRRYIKNWQWGKYYAGDTLYILSRIQDRQAKTYPWATVCTRDGCLSDDRVTIQQTPTNTEILYADASIRFVVQRHLRLEQILFFVPSFRDSVQWIEKIREVLLAFIPDRVGFQFVRRIFSNTVYERRKTFFTDEAGNAGKAFRESMRF